MSNNLLELCFNINDYEDASFRRNHSFRSIHDKYQRLCHELDTFLAREQVHSAQFELIDRFVEDCFLGLDDRGKVLELMMLLSQHRVESHPKALTCVESDGTLFFACRNVTQRVIRKIEIIDRGEIENIVSLVTSLFASSSVFRSIFYAFVYDKYPAIVPYRPATHNPEQQLDGVGRMGLFFAHFFAKSIDSLQSGIFPWTPQKSIDFILYHLEAFKKMIATDIDNCAPFVFLSEFLPIVRPYLLHTVRRSEVLELVLELAARTNKAKSHYSQKLATILEELLQQLICD